MRKLAEEFGLFWVFLALIPGEAVISSVGKSLELSSQLIVSIQLPLLGLQLFGIFMLIRYRNEIF